MAQCLHCGRGFKSRHPSQKFCPPVKFGSLSRRGRRICKDAYHNARRPEIETKDGVAVGRDFVGITDQEHDEIMSSERDDF